jgi:hypothetical protein
LRILYLATDMRAATTRRRYMLIAIGLAILFAILFPQAMRWVLLAVLLLFAAFLKFG